MPALFAGAHNHIPIRVTLLIMTCRASRIVVTFCPSSPLAGVELLSASLNRHALLYRFTSLTWKAASRLCSLLPTSIPSLSIPDGRGTRAATRSRIAAAAKLAGIDHIDYVLLTHYHVDHTGGVPQLVAKIPVKTFIDHGPNRETTDATDRTSGRGVSRRSWPPAHYGHIVAKPGDVLPIPGMQVTVVSADGNLIGHPLPGGGAPNQYCATSEKRPADQTENARSLGVMITYGKLHILDLGDLTWDKEMELMCPVNKIGHVDLLVVSHHGWNQSSSPALIDAIGARVAIMDNGAKKGGSPSVWDTIEKAPGLEDLWQLHYSEEGGPTHNVDAARIANLQGPDTGNYLKVDSVSEWADWTFSMSGRER